MLTLYHSPNSRSSRIIRLIDELNVWNEIDVQIVGVARNDGTGGHDPKNPHPEGKVPLLVHNGVEIWEYNAIILYLTDLFAKAGMGPGVGDPQRGRGGVDARELHHVVEPVVAIGVANLSHPVLDVTFRGMPEMIARLACALESTPFLMGESFTAADLLLVSTFTWSPDAAPDNQAIKEWINRCEARPSAKRIAEFDSKHVEQSSDV